MPESQAFVWLVVCTFAITTLFVVRMAIDCIRNEEGPARILWLTLLIITHIIGSIIYFIIRYLPRVRAQQKGSGSSGSNNSGGSSSFGSSKKRKRAPHKKPKRRGPG